MKTFFNSTIYAMVMIFAVTIFSLTANAQLGVAPDGFAYDQNGQLVQVDNSAAQQSQIAPPAGHEFRYDANGALIVDANGNPVAFPIGSNTGVGQTPALSWQYQQPQQQFVSLPPPNPCTVAPGTRIFSPTTYVDQYGNQQVTYTDQTGYVLPSIGFTVDQCGVAHPMGAIASAVMSAEVATEYGNEFSFDGKKKYLELYADNNVVLVPISLKQEMKFLNVRLKQTRYDKNKQICVKYVPRMLPSTCCNGFSTPVLIYAGYDVCPVKSEDCAECPPGFYTAGK